MENYESYAADEIVLLMSNLGNSEENFISNREEGYKLGFCGFQNNELVKKTSVNNSEQYRLTEEALDMLYSFHEKGILLNEINLFSIPDVIICPAGFKVKPEILEFLSQDDVPISFVRLSDEITSDYTLNPNDPTYLRQIEEMAYYNRLEKNKIAAKNRAAAIEQEAERKFGNDEDQKQKYIIEQLKEMYKKKDPVTYNHICGMLDLIPVMQAGLPDNEKLTEDEYKDLYNMVVLHDLGKLAIPSQVLDKPGNLTPTEIDRMHSHVLMENACIINNACLQELLKRALSHHKKANVDDKRVDLSIENTIPKDGIGTRKVGIDTGDFGYWDSTKLGNIKMEKLEKILPILDSYNALTATDRPYKKGFSPEDAIGIMGKKHNNEPLNYDEHYLRAFVNGLDKFNMLYGSDNIEKDSGGLSL